MPRDLQAGLQPAEGFPSSGVPGALWAFPEGLAWASHARGGAGFRVLILRGKKRRPHGIRWWAPDTLAWERAGLRTPAAALRLPKLLGPPRAPSCSTTSSSSSAGRLRAGTQGRPWLTSVLGHAPAEAPFLAEGPGLH